MNPVVSFSIPTPHSILQPEVTGIYFHDTWTWVCMAWSGAGIPHSWGNPSHFYPPHLDMGWPVPRLHNSPHLSVFLLLVPLWMNVASLNPWLLDFHTAQLSDECGWYLFCGLVVIFAIVVWGWKLFFYASILTVSSKYIFLLLTKQNICQKFLYTYFINWLLSYILYAK